MNGLRVFDYKEMEVRTVEKNGEYWWVLKDVCDVLGLTNATMIADRLDEDEVTKFNLGSRSGISNIINESGLYNVILRSDKPEAKPFKKWVTSEVLPSIRRTGTYTVNKNQDERAKTLAIKEMNAKVRMSNQFLKLSNVITLSTEYKNILVSKATEVLTGEQLIPLPKSKQKTYSAAEIGKMFGVSAQKIGSISNRNNLKTEDFGEWYRSKSEYSNKEVDTWVYYDSAIPEFENLLGVHAMVV